MTDREFCIECKTNRKQRYVGIHNEEGNQKERNNRVIDGQVERATEMPVGEKERWVERTTERKV